SPHSGGVAVRLLGESEHDDLLDLGPEIPFYEAPVAAGDVGVEAGTADVLAHFVDDQHVDLVEVQLWHQAFGLFLQHGLPARDLVRRHDLDDSGLVVRVFDDPYAEQNVALRQVHVAHLGQQGRECVHAVLVVGGGAVDLADADREHLGHAALGCAAKRGMRLDPVDDDNALGFGREAVHVHGRAIVELADDHGVHGRFNRHAHRRFRNAIAFQHFSLAFGCRRSVAAHRWKNKRFGAKGQQFADHALGNDRYVGDAAAAAADGNDLSGLNLGPDFGTLKFPGHRRRDVAQVGGVEFLANVDHARQGDIEPSRDVHLYFVFDHVGLLRQADSRARHRALRGS